MKKVIKFLSIIRIICCLFTLSSCKKYKFKYDTIEELCAVLDEIGYNYEVETKQEVDKSMFEGYENGYEGFIGGVIGNNKENTECFIVMLYKNKTIANFMLEKSYDYILEGINVEYSEFNAKIIQGHDGCWIYAGTAGALSDITK